MRRLLQSLRVVVSLMIAVSAGTLPACGSMGGGMHYFVGPPAVSVL
jgi:hypothetical protein